MRLTLRNAIARSGRSQREFARAVPMREPRLSEIIHAWADPTPDERAAIARVLGRPLRGLFRNDAVDDNSGAAA